MNLRDELLDRVRHGHGYGKMSATPPSKDSQIALAEDEINHMNHAEFLQLLSDVIDDIFPEPDDFSHDDEIDDSLRRRREMTGK